MRSVMMAIAALVLGLALGWASALTVERGVAPRDADEMYQRMSLALDNFEDVVERTATVTRLTRQLSLENLDGAVRAFRERAVSPVVSSLDIRVFLAGWARLEGEKITEETMEWGSDRFYRLSMAAVIHELARLGEVERAKQVFYRVPEGVREQAVSALFVSWAAFGDVESAEEIVLSFPAGGDRDLAMQILVGQLLVSQGRDALEAWVERLEAPGPDLFKHQAFEYAVRAMVKHSVDDAVEWVEEKRATREGWARRGPEFVVEAWAKIDPRAAVEWVLSLDLEDDVEARVQRRAVASVMERWTKANPETAAEWLLLREPEQQYDAHTEALARHYSRLAPRKAAIFSNRIVRESRRERNHELLRQVWQRHDRREELYQLLGPGGPTSMDGWAS